VERFFDQPDNRGRYHRIVPDNSIELVLSEHPIERRPLGTEESQHFTSHLTGFKTRPQEIKLHRSCLLAIRFRVHGLYRFTGIDARELVDQNLHPELVFGRSFAILEEQLLEAADMAERLELIERYFLKKLNRHLLLQDPWFENFLSCLEAGKGKLPITSLAARFNVSIKTLERKCRQHLGLTPKKYSRLIRLFHTLCTVPDGMLLTDIAYQHGYYDQMHFIKEVKYFTGMSPGAYFQKDRGIQEPIFNPGTRTGVSALYCS
jgi:AraC-like DNA-binding protein